MAHNEYWLMDPYHLEEAELEYELRLRNVASVGNGSVRAKCSFLKGLLKEEQDETRERTAKWPSPLQFMNDVQLCEVAVNRLSRWAQGSCGTEGEYRAAWSRMLHLVARVKRMKARIPSEHDKKVVLHQRICELSSHIYRAVEYFSERNDWPNNSGQFNGRGPYTPAAVAHSAAAQGSQTDQRDSLENSREAVQPPESLCVPEPQAVSSRRTSATNPISLDGLFASFSRQGHERPQSTGRQSDASNRVHFRQTESIIPDPSGVSNNEAMRFDIPSAFNMSNGSSQPIQQNEMNQHVQNNVNQRSGRTNINEGSMTTHQGSMRHPRRQMDGEPNSLRVPVDINYQRQPNMNNTAYPMRDNPDNNGHQGFRSDPRPRNLFQNPDERFNSNFSRSEPIWNNQSGNSSNGERNIYPWLNNVQNEGLYSNTRPAQPRVWSDIPQSVYNGNYGYGVAPSTMSQVSSRKYVPVNQWRISFSAEVKSDVKTDLNIHDFLEQVQMFSRAECISEDELLRQMVHLLHGRARAWYQNVYQHINSWADFVRAIKDKFLPLDYHFNLLVEIENRFQRKDEPAGSFINDMELRFRSLPQPLYESHKVHIIRKNLLASYAMPLANMDIRTVKQLEECCKRIESAKLILQARIDRAQKKPDHGRYRREIAYLEEGYSEPESEVDVAVVKSREHGKSRSASVPRVRKETQKQNDKTGANYNDKDKKSEMKCYRCGRLGHMRKDCQEDKIHCYKCGKPDYTVYKCPDCNPSKNSTTNQRDAAQLDSSDQSAQ